MERKHFFPLLAVLLALLTGCGAPPKQITVGMGEAPDWVTRPEADKGIGAAECVPASEDFSSDREKAVGLARRNLAQQLRNRVQAMDTAYRQRVAEEETTEDGTPFAGAAPQLIREALRGIEPSRMGYEKLKDRKHFCVALLLSREKMRRFFERLVQRSGAEIAPRDREMLYNVFRAGSSRESKGTD